MGPGLYILFSAAQYLKEYISIYISFDVKESFHGLFILFYFINGTSLMGTLFQKIFSIGIFVVVCLFTEN